MNTYSKSSKKSAENSPASINRRKPSNAITHINQQKSVQNILRTSGAQAKLHIGQIDDQYEQEADRVAEQIVKQASPPLIAAGGESLRINSASQSRVIQRLCVSCRKEQQLNTDKTQPGAMPETKPLTQYSLFSLQGKGQPMSSSERRFYEPRFGTDFSKVRIHKDKQASNISQSINARAFTLGHNIVFSAGEYSTDSLSGRKLLAHELTHVVQQNALETQAPGRSLDRNTCSRKMHKSSPVHTIQRAVREVPQENIQKGARACLVHLHGNEQNALQTGNSLFASHCVNFVHLNNTGRCVDTGIPGCNADPNRIFSTDQVTRQNAFGAACRCSSSKKKRAVKALRQFHDNSLAPAISRCRGGSGSGLSGPLPVVALHNNTQGAFSINSYNPGGSEAAATETDPARTGGVTNPSRVAGQDVDNFLLTTQSADFNALRGSRNAVLQSDSPHDDGSLSVAMASERYINVESEGKRFVNRAAASFVTNRTMALEVLVHLGAGSKPCTTGSTSPKGRAASKTGNQNHEPESEPTDSKN